MTISLRANNDGSATVLVQGTPRITIDSSGNIQGTVTPPFSDSSFKLADTEFVKNVSRSFKGVSIISSSVTTSVSVTPSDAGRLFVVNIDAGSVTLTLPSISSVDIGTVYRFNVGSSSGSNRMLVSPSGSDVIFGGSGYAYTNSLPATMGSGEYIEVIRNGAQWSVIDGPLTLNYNGTVFAGFNSGNGYRRLPGGTIVQWGYAGPNSSGISTVTFPIPFPNGLPWAITTGELAIGLASFGKTTVIDAGFTTNSSFRSVTYQFTAGTLQPSTNGYQWVAVGA